MVFAVSHEVQNKPLLKVSIFELMSKRAWDEYKDHISTCETCSNISENVKHKMCPYSYLLAEAAKPMITNDQLRLIAQDRLKIVSE